MKKNFLFLTAIAIMSAMSIVSCSWDDETDSPELRKAYYQTQSFENNDSTSSGYRSDSVYVSRTTGISGTTADSVQCNLMVDGKLIVDGGSSSDLSDTYVTVEKIIVRLWIDGQTEPVEYYPETNKEVAEPSDVYAWGTMPQGIKYARKTLCEQPVAFSYRDYFYVEVNVCYMLRVRDTKLAAGCTADRYWCKKVGGSTNFREKSMNILVPLELHTIYFDATVDGWSNNNNNVN